MRIIHNKGYPVNPLQGPSLCLGTKSDLSRRHITSGAGRSNNSITFFPICGPHFNERVKRELFELTKTIIGLFWWFSGKESACNAGDMNSIPESGRSPGEANGSPLRYSCLGKPMDRGVWWATVHGVAKSQTWLKWLSTHSVCSSIPVSQLIPPFPACVPTSILYVCISIPALLIGSSVSFF